jgi:hypothetical protein
MDRKTGDVVAAFAVLAAITAGTSYYFFQSHPQTHGVTELFHILGVVALLVALGSTYLVFATAFDLPPRLIRNERNEQKPPKVVSDLHLSDLHATATKLSAAVSDNSAEAVGTRAERIAFRGHFPELYEQFSQWMVQTQLLGVHPKFLWLRIDRGLYEKGIVHPILSRGFANYLTLIIQTRASQNLPDDFYFDFGWIDLENGDVEAPGCGTVIFSAPALAEGRTTAQCKKDIEEVFWEQSKWLNEKIRGVREKLEKVTPHLVDRLDTAADLYEVRGECPRCNQDLIGQISGGI